MEEGVGFACCTICAPMSPVLLPSLGSLVSDSIGNASPSKQEVTRQANFFGTCRTVQHAVCGRGKCVEK